MQRLRFRNALVVLPLLLFCANAARGAVADWREVSGQPKAGVEAPRAYRLMQVDLPALRAELQRAPKSLPGIDRGLEIELPTPDGDFQRFRVVEASILSPELQASRPHLRTYRGVGVDDEGARVRLGYSQESFHATVRSPHGGWSILEREGFDRGDLVVAYRRDLPPSRFTCEVIDDFDAPTEFEPVLGKALGENLVTYRIALTGTGEYTQFHGSVAAGEADMTLLINVVNNVYENELGVTFQIVDFNIYPDPATDPFPTGMVINTTLLNQNNSALNAKLGSGGYDVGHILGQLPSGGTSGLAYVGGQCSFSIQGGGGTLAGIPRAGTVSDTVLHEIGHQLGSRHTFNSETGGCNGNRSASWAHEIGSGVTIMSYAGLCGAENVVNDQIDVFNAGAFQQINSRISSTPSCGTRTDLGNDAPVVSAGPAQQIPRSTAFLLQGSATDANDDPLTYSWEQYDLGPSDSHIVQTSGPLFRNFAPISGPDRSFPNYSAYRRGSSTPWEYLPGVDRSMVFRLVVRDNNPAVGSVNWSTTTVQVSGDPFVVTAPNGGESFETGQSVLVTWDVGGTVDADVRILFSSDAGVSWTEVVASTPNDGSETVPLACVPTIEGRVRIEGTTNGWFDLSNNDFTVVADNDPPVVTCPDPITVIASGPDGLSRNDPQLAAFFAAASAFDPCEEDLAIVDFAPDTFPVGDTIVAFSATDQFGNFGLCTVTVTVDEDTGTASPGLPEATRLIGVHPNPFNPRTTVAFSLGRDQQARIDVLDARGRRVAVLQDGPLPRGEHAVTWDGRDERGAVAPSGVYFFRMTADDGVQTRRAALLK